ncbi:vimentin yjdA, partial [Escherichia coli]|nr:vimentin yjdA [Escherichia coli]EEU3015111.1 vimentin yjdA [Escherichia coli]EEX1188793.1 vimentin yjdA [Escherichia coli]EFC3574266.1 vimentin yjdA [Escherichia coli]
MLPSEIMIWQPEFTDKILSRKPGAAQSGLWGKISQWSGINNQGREDYRKRDFAPDSPEIKFSDRR